MNVPVREKKNPVHKGGWKSIHKKYKACQSKRKHMKGKTKTIKIARMKWKT
jgi:hypothetical protein